ncbi:MAG: hypothetical protein MUO31_14140 [Thermodesulfovibrionales bacterium]|nr:hypothetical protein [Thermodesulfovibrionales bacterium]
MGFFSSSDDLSLNNKANLIVDDLFNLFNLFIYDLKNEIPVLQTIDGECAKLVKLDFIIVGSIYLINILSEQNLSNKKYRKLIEKLYIAGNSKSQDYEERVKKCKELILYGIEPYKERKKTQQDLYDAIKLNLGFEACSNFPHGWGRGAHKDSFNIIGEYIINRINMYWKIERDTYLPF